MALVQRRDGSIIEVSDRHIALHKKYPNIYAAPEDCSSQEELRELHREQSKTEKWNEKISEIPFIRKGHVDTYRKKVCRKFYGSYPVLDVDDIKDEYDREEEIQRRKNAFLNSKISDFFELLELTEQRLICFILHYPVSSDPENGKKRWYTNLTMQQLNKVCGTDFKDTKKVYGFLENLAAKEFVAHNAPYIPFVTCQYENPNDNRILIGNDFSVYLALWDEDYVEKLKEYIKNKITCSNDKRFIDILDPTYLETVLSI